jgi:formamidopyrimidine-DNA glycosylase
LEIEEIIKKRNELEQRKSRLLGKMEVAISTLSEIDSKFQEMGIDPTNVEVEIERLQREREEKIKSLKTSLTLAEKAITAVEESVNNL